MAQSPPSVTGQDRIGKSGRHKYRTAPDANLTTVPPGVPYIVGNEAAERFSFYGMRSILAIFMTTYLLGANGQLEVMSENEAGAWFHSFVAAVYFFPLAGAIISDCFWGKYRTILILSIVYCAGHFALALDDTRLGLFIGLSLIAIGSGGIKPCVSAHVGDQFGASNKHLLTKVYGWFYLSINIGSTISSYFCPVLLNDKRFGPHFAFGLPGVFMLIATIVFWLGRNKFVHVPPGGSKFWRELFSLEGIKVIARLFVLYLFIALFWAMWDQSSGGEWTLQAAHLDLNLFGWRILPEQVQILNPILILILVPLFNYWIYPAIDRVFVLTPLRKVGIGLFVTAASFVPIWLIELHLAQGQKPSVWWQTPAYILLTAGEILISITGLEFSYTQAPRKMKSAVMALFLLSVSLGNFFTATVHGTLIPALKHIGFNLEGPNFYLMFICLMIPAALLFGFVARTYRGRTYLQDGE
jgi:proton-dependent oligopeptide transporter, POT family